MSGMSLDTFTFWAIFICRLYSTGSSVSGLSSLSMARRSPVPGVPQEGKVTYMPVYFVMFMEADTPNIDEDEYIF